MTTQQDSGRHFVRVRLDGFRGHTLDVPLSRGVNVLTGPNQAGKTSVRDGLALAVTGCLPGEKVDTKAGLADTAVLSECTPGAGAFAVEATDSAGYQVRFRYSEGEQQGVRSVTSTLIESRRNAEHQVAIAARYGTGGRVLGAAALDPVALRRADDTALEAEILRMCGGSNAAWSGPRVLDELAERTWWALTQSVRTDLGAVYPDPGAVRRHLAAQQADVDGVPVAFGDVADPRVLLSLLSVHVATQLTDARSDVKGLRDDVTLEIPDAPGEADVAQLDAQRQKARERVAGLQQELGRLQGRYEAECEAARKRQGPTAEDAAYREISEQLAGMRLEMTVLLEKIAHIEAETGKAKGALDEARASVTRTRGILETRTAAAEAAQQALDEAEGAQAQQAEGGALEDYPGVIRACAELAVAEQRRAALEAEPTPVVDPAMHDEIDRLSLEREGATVRKAEAEAKGTAAATRLGELEARASRLADGQCPECGQDASRVLSGDILPALDATKAEVAAQREAFTAARDTIKKTDQAIEKLRTEVRGIRAAADALRANQDKAREAERAARSALDLATEAAAQQERQQARARAAAVAAARQALDAHKAAASEAAVALAHAEAAVPVAERQAEQFTAALEEARAMREYGRAQIAEWTRKQADAALAKPAARPFVPAEPAVLGVMQDQIADATADLETYEAAHGAAVEQRRAQADVRARKTHAEKQKAQAQARRALWTTADRQLGALEREVMAAYVAPFVEPVNALLEAAGVVERYGRFAIRFGRRFQLGFEAADDFAPLSQLSAGHSAVAGALIITVAHQLAGSRYRLLAVDNAESIDGETRPTFLAMLAWLCDAGHLDQVLLGAVDAYDWAGLAEGVRVTDLRTCGTGTGKASESDETEKAAAA